MKAPTRGVALALLLAWLLPVGAAEPSNRHSSIERVGSLLQYGIPATALLATWLIRRPAPNADDPAMPDEDTQSKGDRSILAMGGTPRHDLSLALGRTWLATEALKYSIDETRPDGGRHSFPSGHASIAFAAAEFIRSEYGWRYAAPAYLAAGFVGWSRIESKRHYVHDVIAGAALGVLANHDFWHWSGRTSEFTLAPLTMDWNGKLAPGLQFEFDF